ncbi:hypothetical protein [Priestia megaterium]|uniref:hypothetical protein n=1 Tax=Priestia megaterium TaxID=1404 RepID=UPI0032428FDB
MKSRAKSKTYSYMEIEGVHSSVLDYLLVSMMPYESLIQVSLKNESLLKSLPFNRIQLMNKSISKDDLIDHLSENLKDFYEIYNAMMTAVYPDIQSLEDEIQHNLPQIKNEKNRLKRIYDEMINELDGDHLSKNKLACWLRTKPELKEELINLIEDIQLQDEERNNMVDSVEEIGDVSTLKNQVDLMKKVILSMEKQVSELDQEQIKKLNEEISQLKDSVTETKEELKLKEKEIKTKDKEIQKLQKKCDEEIKKKENEKKVAEKYQKENGEISKKLGETRSELEKITMEHSTLQRNVERLEKERKNLEYKISKKWEDQLNNKIALLKTNYEEEIYSLQKSLEITKSENDSISQEDQLRNENLNSENQHLKAQIAELTRQLQQASVAASIQPVDTSAETEVEEEYEELSDLFEDTEHEPEFS